MIPDWADPALDAPQPKFQQREYEVALQRAVVQFLRLALPADAVFCHVPNRGRRGTAEAALLAGLGQLAGVPDLLVVWRGKAAFIELKTRHGALSKIQKRTHQRIHDAGAPVWLCRSIDDVAARLSSFGVALRANCGINAPPRRD